MLVAYATALLLCGLPVTEASDQDQTAIVGVVVDGVERVWFSPRAEPYTQGGPAVGYPVRESSAKTKDGLPVRGLEFIGWKEGDGYRVFAFVVVPPKAGAAETSDRRLDFGSAHIRLNEAVTFDKMKELGLTPWTIKVRPKA